MLTKRLRNDAALKKVAMTWFIQLRIAVGRTFASSAVLGIAALATVQAAQQFWETKPFIEWTRSEAVKVLSSSPWVRQVSILLPADAAPVDADPTGAEPRAGAGVPSGSGAPRHQRASITVMWVAAPIREAHIRLDQFNGHMRDEKYWRPAVRGNPEIIQLTVAGTALAQMLTSDDPRLRAATYLKMKRGKRVPARDVVFSKDYPRIPEVTIVFPAHTDGAPSITAADEEATLVMPLGAHTITVRFKLRDMIVRGQLML